MTVTGFAGSLPFMPREQAINFKDSKPVSDVLGYGASFYTMLMGNVPCPSKLAHDLIDAILHGQMIPFRQWDAGLPQEIAAVIDRSWTAEPQDR